ncbi:MAG: polysaccharide biosynthesis protein, partial [Gemmatimonadota bacterium]|nr:polysaccharide biosynthesis protein [Gemmatimonadota bacterium]
MLSMLALTPPEASTSASAFGYRIGRQSLAIALDLGIAIVAIAVAYELRFEATVPVVHARTLAWAWPAVALVRGCCSALFGVHRWSFRMSGLSEAARLMMAVALGSTVFVALSLAIPGFSVPKSVLALEFFISATLMGGYRFAPRLAAGWYLERRRARTAGTRTALILGAGSAGDLLLRDMLRSPANTYQILGFLDDDARKRGAHIGGRPVLGSLKDLPEIAPRLGVTDVLIAIPRLSPDRIRWILRLCSTLKLSFKIIPASFAVLDQKISAAMLHELTPEDLLPRDQVTFDPSEIHKQIKGRRVLVTGAGGSIGGEIARQVASHEPSQLVLVDLNENELYFLARRLQELYPQMELHSVVADIRDATKISRLGRRFRPDYVFHAAAHKHVPLMEDAPDEAVKNNVFGTLNLAKMADECGAQRFVLISTDKAVRPSSVMGASKRIAELVVRDLASRSKTSFTAVRFGNVLGSAGSVVPLFKQQIQRGGPVTVTHPACTRYFMTIPEAVGLVLLSGLGGYGELCILDMGEPIRIAELASNLITMAGLVPGKDIPIVFTGLRPGEKLAEELMSEEEEHTQAVRDRIMVARSPAPPADLGERLEMLRRVAEAGDFNLVRQQIRNLVPTYTP